MDIGYVLLPAGLNFKQMKFALLLANMFGSVVILMMKLSGAIFDMRNREQIPCIIT